MDHSENAMLVYLAGAVGAAPTEADVFQLKARKVSARPSKQYLDAIDNLLQLVQKADPSEARGYRERLLGLARDNRVVSRSSSDYPLNAAKSAVLTALDYR